MKWIPTSALIILRNGLGLPQGKPRARMTPGPSDVRQDSSAG